MERATVDSDGRPFPCVAGECRRSSRYNERMRQLRKGGLGDAMIQTRARRQREAWLPTCGE